MEDPLQTAIYAAVIPALIAAAVLLALRQLRRGAPRPADAGIPVAAGFVAGFLGVMGMPQRFPPLEHWHWLLHVAPLAAAVGALDARAKAAPSWLRWLLRSGLIVFAVRAVAPATAPLPLALIAFAAALVLISLDGLAARGEQVSALLVALLLAMGTAVSVALSGFANAGFVCGALAAALGACLAVSRSVSVSARGVSVVAGVVAAVTGIAGVVYAEMTWTVGTLLVLGPIAAAVVELTITSRLQRWKAIAACTGAAALFTAAAVTLAAIQR